MFTGLIKNNKLFYKINESEINLLLTSENIITKMKGEVIYKEGEPGDSVYLVISGEVCIAKERFLGRVKKENKLVNDFFGEESYLENIPRPFTAYATNESKLLQLEKARLDQICSVNQQFFNNLKRTPDEVIAPETELNTAPESSPSITEEESSFESTIPEESFNDNTQSDPTVPTVDLVVEDTTDGFAVNEPEINLDGDFTIVSSSDENKQETIDEPAITPENNFELGPDYSYEIKNDGLYEIPQNPAEELQDVSSLMVSDSEADIIESNDIVISQDVISDTPGISEQETIPTVQEPVKEIVPADIPLQNVKITTKDGLSAEHLQLIIQAAQSVNSNIKIDDVLQSIVNAARGLTGAERGTLYLVDKEKEEIWSKVLDGKELREIRLKFGQGIAGWVVNNKETVNIKDVQYDHRFDDQVDHSSGFHTKNMLCFPICNKTDDVIGVLQLLNSTKGEFTDLDEEYLKMLSINAALALENAELVEKLLQSERITSLGKMANFLIQDIKKPVLVSKRYAEHLKSKNVSPEINQVIDMLLEQLTHVADLVQTTSSFSEGKTILHSASCQLNEALGEILSKLESYVTIHNCKLVKEFGTDAKVKLDRKEFYQCCMHIVRNACDAMPEGGVISISTKTTVDSASIIFKDNGLGIPDSIKDKIFEPFMSHGKKEGTGLGLSITKKIVEDHGGTISVESDIGEGATFIITLPVS